VNGARPTTTSTAACVSLGITTLFNTHSSVVKLELETTYEKFHIGWVFVNISLLPKCSGQILNPLLSSLMILLSLVWGTSLVTASLFGKNAYYKVLAVLIVLTDLFAVVVAFANMDRRESAEHCLLVVFSLLHLLQQ
jgi:hypothetical protein